MEDLVKALSSKYEIKGYLSEGKIRAKLAEVNSTEEAEDVMKALFEEASAKRETAYQNRVANYEKAESIQDFQNVKETLEALDGYKDTTELALKCQIKIDELKAQRAKERKEEEAVLEQQLTEVYKQDKKEFKWMLVGGTIFILVTTVILLWLGQKIMLM